MLRASKKESITEKRFDIVHIFKSLGLSYVLSVVLLFALSLLAVFFDMGGKTVNVFIIFITAISVMFCGFCAARKMGSGGLFNGVVAGTLYTLLLYAVGNIIAGSLAFNLASVAAFGVGIVCGGIGGVLGVNLGQHRR